MDDSKKFYYTVSLHRYFIWANRQREFFYDCLKDDKKEKNGIEIEQVMYMSLWYAGLYVVCEGWIELKLQDSKIENLINSKNLDLLRLYRNATYHFQKEYYHEKFGKLISEGEDVVKWVRELNNEFGRFFLDWAEQRKKQTKVS